MRTSGLYPCNALIKGFDFFLIFYAATAYDNPIMSKSIIIIFNEGMYYVESMYHSFIDPNHFINDGVDLWGIHMTMILTCVLR